MGIVETCAVDIEAAELGRLMPMYVHLSNDGIILAAGPTLSKIAGRQLVGKGFLDVLEVRRPRSITTFQVLRNHLDNTLHLSLRGDPPTLFRAVAARTGGQGGGILLNLSFGIHVYDAVSQHRLNLSDFAATDLAIEMLYLKEAKSAAMDESRRLNERLETARRVAQETAVTDLLTGLPNRRGFELKISERMGRNEPFAVMVLDLDFFKAVNDTLGHEAGDVVLQTAAKRFLNCMRRGDVVARMGGDEFLGLCDGTADPDHLKAVGERLIESLEAPIEYHGRECKVSASIGIVVAEDDGNTTLAELLKMADEALYVSKRNGRGQVSIAGIPTTDQSDGLEVENTKVVSFRSARNTS
ncbi:MAG: GGDEF domain-containing protein [Boseongicola sp.]|nr:GGDEF domain-containing protein [Boseongicola sp.]MDD9979429.1 GGDEF domain-containing protein [Boseongicola sp.]